MSKQDSSDIIINTKIFPSGDNRRKNQHIETGVMSSYLNI
jgi:hypothetical protein